MNETKTYFKAIIRVVKSITSKNEYFRGGFDTVDVLHEPLIEAVDKSDVKAILLEKYPQFFQNDKVYEKETKDQAQFFYVVIFPLYNHEIKLIEEGSWICDYCGHIHENKYISRPLASRKYEGKIFCASDYKTGNDIVSEPDCYERWKKEVVIKDDFLPDDMNYVNSNSPIFIYKCTEKSSQKCYIGKTKNAPFFRWWNHLKHSSSPFGTYLRQTKLSEWTFEVLQELAPNTNDNEVLKIESDYIVKFDSINNGYNTVISNKKALNTPSGTLFEN